MKKGSVFMVLALYVGLSGVTFAVDEPVKATGNFIHGDAEKKISYIEGNVQIIQGSTSITTDKAIIFMDKKQVLLENNVVLVNTDGTINADYLDLDLKKKCGVFKGNVVMERKEIRDSKTKKVKKESFALRAEELYIESEKQNFVATNSKIENKEFTGSANKIVYDDATEEMVFKGNVHLKKGKGEEITGEETTINLKDKSFQATNNVCIEITVENDGDEQPTNSKKDKARKKK